MSHEDVQHLRTTPSPSPRRLRRVRSRAAALALRGVASFALIGLALPSAALAASKSSKGAKSKPLPGAGIFASAYSDLEPVQAVRQASGLPILHRERALSRGMPFDRALAIIDAIGAENARRLGLADALVGALRARHSIGPSGALLGKPISATALTPREAMLLGWLRAMEAGADAKALAKRGESIREAGALQLLQRAATLEPKRQAAALAYALAASVGAPRKGQCDAWQAVQRAAREGGDEAVRVQVANAATATVSSFGKRCSKKIRDTYASAIRLPEAKAEVDAPTLRGGRGPSRPPRPSRGGDAFQRGIAWTIMAPVHQGYMSDKAIAALVQRERLDEVKLEQILARDPTGDLAIAALNASILSRRVDFDDNLEIAWLAVVRRHRMLDATPAQRRALPLTSLTGPEAMALAYGKCIAGEGALPAPSTAATTAHDATPEQLFAFAATRVPGNAALGPLMQAAHKVDQARASGACAASSALAIASSHAARSRLSAGALQALDAKFGEVRGACSGGSKATR